LTAVINDSSPGVREQIPSPVRSAGDEEMRGRDPERQAIQGLLRRARQGIGGVVLVEGEPGIGKSLLLREAADEAAIEGFSLAAGAADELGQAISFSALRAALGVPFATLADDSRGDLPDTAWSIGKMQAHLEHRASIHPVLVCLDDLHWESRGALAALRTLPRELKRDRVAWLFARSSTPHHDTEYLFSFLEEDGGARISLGPLGDDAVAALLADAFGAPPDRGLLALARGAAGNPSLLTELIRGLRDDNGVQVVDGGAVLVSTQLPQRMHRVGKQRLDALSKQARHMLVTASVLGASFRLEDAAEMLGETPTTLLPAVEEAMGAGIMIVAENAFSFRHPLLRRVVAEMIPLPARNALHRQYGQILLGRGGSTALAACHLLKAAHPDDPASLADLDTAAAQALRSAPRTAADLALRALDLTPAAASGAVERSVAAAEALAAAGRLDHAARIARDTVDKPLPAAAEARLRCVLSTAACVGGQASDAHAEARLALAKPQLPEGLRDRALTAQLQALAGLHDELAGPVADAIRADPGQHDRHVIATAHLTSAVMAWDKGQVTEGLELLREAARDGAGVSPDARDGQPLLVLAAALIDLRLLDEAENILHATADQAPDATQARATLPILRARIHLANGRLGDGDAEGRAGLDLAETIGAHGYASTARSVLAVIALRRGDIAAAVGHTAWRPVSMPHFPAIYARIECTVAEAQISEARSGPAAAVGHLRQVLANLPAHRGLLLGDPAVAAWVVRTALAAGDDELALSAASTAEALACDNQGFPALTAAAAHSLGLARQDLDRLAQAASEHPDPWARASAAEDMGVLHARRSDPEQAIHHLTLAIQGYQRVGATADTARVRGRLRTLGVRRRHWAPSADRPVSGWKSLTATERIASELVAQGLNNRQVADQMYISVNTVAFHMRQIFRKLGIGSRVELARIVMQQAR
jgi:DNA-binding CsgD family transcriptional regulator